MKILIDCSNLQVGGGIQVALSFLYDVAVIDSLNDFYIVMSPQIEDALDFNRLGNKFHLIAFSKKDHKKIWRRRKNLEDIEKEIKPQVIFTVFGPSYNKSKCPKIVGYAIPHFLYRESPYFKLLNPTEKFKNFLFRKFKIHFFLKNSKYLIFETNDARNIFCDNYFFAKEKTFVVSNCLNQIFIQEDLAIKAFNFGVRTKILCLSANYPHKNLKIIPAVIDEMIKIGLSDFQFIISLNKKDLPFNSRYDKFIKYIGHVPLQNLPSLYKSIDFLFMPTLLEVFSTTFLEAMAMEVPIVTSDLSFCKDVCSDAALYCNPIDPLDFANKLDSVINDDVLQEKLKTAGKLNLQRFGTSMDRTKEYLKIIEKIA